MFGENNSYSLTIATPFFNEEEGIKSYISTIKKIISGLPHNIKVSLLWIDDGSSDNTLDLLKKNREYLENIKTRIIVHKKNYGYGRTLYNSIKNSNSDFLITYDADCCYDFNLVFELLNKILSDKKDIISISYKLANKKMNISFYRNFLANFSIFLYKFLFKSLRAHNLTYFNCSFRIYKLKIIQDLETLSDDFNACAELLIRSSKKNIKISELPGENIGRKFGKSKMKVLKNIYNHLVTMFKIRLNIKNKLQKDNSYLII